MILPGRQEREILEHVDDCKRCAAFMREQQLLEYDLRKLTMVPVPEQLASRILLHQGTQVRRQWACQRRWFATAMTMVLIIAAIMSAGQLAAPVFTGQQVPPRPVEKLVLDHIHGETQYLERRPVIQQPELDRILASVNMTISPAVGPVNYAAECVIRNDRKGVHLVLQGEFGPVTVLIMPGEALAVRTPVQDQRFRGVVYPARYGSIAVVGEKGEPIETVEDRIKVATGFVS